MKSCAVCARAWYLAVLCCAVLCCAVLCCACVCVCVWGGGGLALHRWNDAVTASTFTNSLFLHRSLGLSPPGTTSPSGSPPGIPCPAGQFAGRRGDSACAPCPAGRFAPAGDGAACVPCPAGRFSADAGAAVCTPCEAGRFGTVPGLNASACSGPCPSGRFSAVPGGTACRVANVTALGAPTFSRQDFAGSPAAPRAVAAADVDGDGFVDVLAASASENTVVWFRSSGGSPAAWTPFTITSTALGAACVLAADIDGDGRVDAVSASTLSNTVAWYRNGGGSPVVWTAHNVSTSLGGVRTAATADVDADGRLDVISASYYDGWVVWHKNIDGFPVLWAPALVGAGLFEPGWVHAADVDGNGWVDVAASSFNGGALTLYYNQGGSPVGWVAVAVVSASALPARALCTADFDGDGRLDLASASDASVVWYRNPGSALVSWTSVALAGIGGASARSIGAADVDADGDVDMVVAFEASNNVLWYRNQGNGSWLSAQTVSSGVHGPASVSLMDVNGDGCVARAPWACVVP
jgi:hypothetical protein